MEDKILRHEVKNFYNLIKSNDVEGMQEKVNEGFPIKWLGVFAEKPLSEYAMENGNVEAAWWLMANGQMPESWSSFSGSAWKSFLKKGLNMALSNDNTGISLNSYKNIVKIAVKTTGENLPSFIDSAILHSANMATELAGNIFNSLMGRLDKLNESSNREIKENKKERGDEKPQHEKNDNVEKSQNETISANKIKKRASKKQATKKKAPKKTA